MPDIPDACVPDHQELLESLKKAREEVKNVRKHAEAYRKAYEDASWWDRNLAIFDRSFDDELFDLEMAIAALEDTVEDIDEKKENLHICLVEEYQQSFPN